ncbi:MAG: hypothetical protein ACYSWZ_14105 [Planctomycetota bacterium]|jgi:hypothetical protein
MTEKKQSHKIKNWLAEKKRIIIESANQDKALKDNLVTAIAVLIEMFIETKQKVGSVFLWRATLPPDFTERKELWHEILKQEPYTDILCDFNGYDWYGRDGEQKRISYAVTGQGLTLDGWKQIDSICEIATKSLLIDPTYYTKTIKEFYEHMLFMKHDLDEAGIRGQHLILYSYHWFEFVFIVADDFTCPVRLKSQFSNFKNCSDVSCNKIVDDFCEASVTTLRLFREMALRQLPSAEPVKESKETGQNQQEPPNLMTLLVITQNFHVSESTLRRAIKDGRLKSYPNVNGTIRVDAVEVAKLWMRRK